MSTKHARRLSLAVLAAVCALSATGLLLAQTTVTYNAMPGTDYSKFKTYKWVPMEGATHPDQIADHQITQAFDSALAVKGLTKSALDQTDLLVGYQTAITKERKWTAYVGQMGFRVGGGLVSGETSTIEIGTLGLDVYDSSAKQLIWRGSATKALDPRASAQKRQENIEKAVTKLLKNFPPPVRR